MGILICFLSRLDICCIQSLNPLPLLKSFLSVIAVVTDSFMSCLTYNSDERIRMGERTRVELRIIGVEIY